MMKSLVTMTVAASLLLAVDLPDDAVKHEKEKLTGSWRVVSVEANGHKVPAEAIKDFQFIFTTESLTRKKGGKAESGSGYQLDPSKSPKWIDMTGVTDGREQSIPALYQIEGDTLRLCFRTDYKNKERKPNFVQKRPEKLDGGEGSNQVLMVLERE